MPKPKPPVEHFRRINFPAWYTYIVVVLTEDVQASIHKRASDYDVENTGAICMKSDTATSMLIFDINAPCGIIAHECWHAIRRMIVFHGGELENEVVAYHLGYLVEQVCKFQKASARPRRSRK